MKFPEYTSLGFSDDVKENIAKVLQDTKKFLWDGKKPIEYRNDNVKEFICHAVDELYNNVGGYTYGVSLGTVIRFIQTNIDNSMDKSHLTFECWRETVHPKVHQGTSGYDQYVIDVQSHRKAWTDYLIINLKENQK